MALAAALSRYLLAERKNMLSVSVAMATYNGQKHIRRQLESLAAQSHPPAELVITDDGSKDDTLSILDDFAKSSSFPVRAYRNESRLGYRANFMRAATLCGSDLIAFCDQDDNWYPNKLAACVSRFTEPEMLLVYHNADVVLDDGRRTGNLNAFSAGRAVSLPLSLKPLGHVLGFTQVFRNSLLKLTDLWPMSIDHQFDNERMAHDQWFYFLASVLGKIGYLDEPLAAYVQHGQNTYGHSGRTNHLQLAIQYGLQDSAAQLGRRMAATNCRAAILEAAKAQLDSPQNERAAAAARKYRRLSELNAARKKIYVSSKFGERLNSFVKLLGSRGYGGTWNLTGKSFIKDLCIGVPFGSALVQNRSNGTP